MKLPNMCTEEEYTKFHVGEKSAIQLHNEQIAAQLTITHCCGSHNSKEDIDATYKEYLDKLNKGDL